MLLQLSTTHQPATDLGYLLHKNPARLNTIDLAFGRAHVFYPEASETRCTVALLLEVDTVALARSGRFRDDSPLAAYVNDRPYVASSFLSVALAEAFGSALAGNSRERPQLVDEPLPLECQIDVLRCHRGGGELLSRLFGPLGYAVEATTLPFDTSFPEWGTSEYVSLHLSGNVTVRDLLTHLYVLVPVLDDSKHYWVGDDEVEKLLRRGGTWLPTHPERDFITSRYLKHQRSLTADALERLGAEDDEAPATDDSLETSPSLQRLRIEAILAVLKQRGAKRIADLGCGEGSLIRELLGDREFGEILGVDVSSSALSRAEQRLHLADLPQRDRERVRLTQGSLLYRDPRLAGFDAAVLSEVIEHIELDRLDRVAANVLGEAAPDTVVVTTPNAEFNVHFPGLQTHEMRHSDHRFEWTRSEFEEWGRSSATRFGYVVTFDGIGEPHPEAGSPTQMAVFTR